MEAPFRIRPPSAAASSAALTVLLAGALAAGQTLAASASTELRPDLSGTYDTGTITPLERPRWLGETENLYPWVARTLSWFANTALTWAAESASDPDREAPPVGGDGSGNAFGAGNVGGYNVFWIDPGTRAFEINGLYRTSIIVDPPNGRLPPRTEEGRARRDAALASFRHQNTGTAWWLDSEEHGPYDDPEDLAVSERCLLTFSSPAPVLPSLYNNFVRIVQTPDYVLILLEMVHDARIVRLDDTHRPSEFRSWLGDSVGHWEGDTLVVDTVNFRPVTSFLGTDENLHLTERFSKLENGDLLYTFTVNDPSAWEASWTGEYSWRRTNERLYEYACHEGNYAMTNMLKGARMLEQEALSAEEQSAPAADASAGESVNQTIPIRQRGDDDVGGF